MAAILSSIGLSEVDELRVALLVIRLVRRVYGDKIGDERLARGLHGGRIVPEMRIVSGLVADQRPDQDLLASGRLMGRQQLLHPGIIIDAVDDDDLGVRQSPRRTRGSPRTNADRRLDC